MSINAAHDSSPDMIIPGDLDLYRMASPQLRSDFTPEAALQDARAKFCQTIDAASADFIGSGDNAITAERDRERLFQPECVDR